MLINDKIRQLRQARSFTQEYMADQLSMCVNSYSNLECGRVRLTLDKMVSIAKVLETSLSINISYVVENGTGFCVLDLCEAEQAIVKDINVVDEDAKNEKMEHFWKSFYLREKFDFTVQLNLLFLKMHFNTDALKLFEFIEDLYLQILLGMPDSYDVICHLGHLYLRLARRFAKHGDQVKAISMFNKGEYYYQRSYQICSKGSRMMNNKINFQLARFFILRHTSLKEVDGLEIARQDLLQIKALILQYLEFFPNENIDISYNYACVLAGLGEYGEAIKLLDLSIRCPMYKNQEHLWQYDDDLEVLHQTPEFKGWVKNKVMP